MMKWAWKKLNFLHIRFEFATFIIYLCLRLQLVQEFRHLLLHRDLLTRMTTRKKSHQELLLLPPYGGHESWCTTGTATSSVLCVNASVPTGRRACRAPARRQAFLHNNHITLLQCACWLIIVCFRSTHGITPGPLQPEAAAQLSQSN